MGGIVGRANDLGVIRNCNNMMTGSIIGMKSIGGICGAWGGTGSTQSGSKIMNCTNSMLGNIICNAGKISEWNPTFPSVSSTTETTQRGGGARVGGIIGAVGLNNYGGTVENCVVSMVGDLYGGGGCVGGIVGQTQGPSSFDWQSSNNKVRIWIINACKQVMVGNISGGRNRGDHGLGVGGIAGGGVYALRGNLVLIMV